MNKALIDFKTRAQKKLEQDYPVILRIGDVQYKGAIATNTGSFMTLAGGTKQVRSATFQCLASVLPLSVVRDTTVATQPLKRVLITDVAKGLVYRLDEELTDAHGVVRTLTCSQPQD
jgi:hypothetical protein